MTIRNNRLLNTIELNNFLNSLDEELKPTLHINGHNHLNTSILTVDFGSPLKTFRLSQDQMNILSELMKKLAKEITNKDNFKLASDPSNGIYWIYL